MRWCSALLAALLVCLVPAAARAQEYVAPTPVHCQSFDGAPFTPGQTAITALQIVQLRTCINELRQQSALQPYNFSDALTGQVTWIRAVHLLELRQALDQVYQARGGSHAAYYEPITAQSTTIKAIHFNELHTFISQIPRIDCTPTLDRNSINAPWSGGVYYVNVYVPSSCYWESWRDDGLIDLTGQWEGTGPGTITVTIYQNWNHTTHYGTLFVNGVEVAVSLAGDESDPGDDPGAPDDPDDPPPAPDEEDVEYFHSDALGSVRLITNQAGAIVSHYDYLPFGGNWPNTNNDANSRRFAGGERDQSTGFDATQALDYFGARFYQPLAGRFTAVDPVVAFERSALDPQSWNRYAYVRNNPIRNVDPDGRFWGAIGNFLQTVGGGVVSAVSATVGWLVSPQFEAVLVDGPDSVPQPTPLLSPENGVAVAAGVGSGIVNVSINGFRFAAGINGVPRTLARVIPGRITPTSLSLGKDAFVTAAEDIAGLNADQLAARLAIPKSEYFTVIEFPTPGSGVASPMFRTNPGFIGGGFTAGGAREFVVPNGPLPAGASIRIVGP